jgi:beta-phosphoglucomutase
VALRAIIFDFDGVIANSEPLHLRSFQDVLAAEGIALAEREYYARYLGFDDVGVFERISAERGGRWTPEHIDTLVARKAQRMEVLERDVSILFPGAADAVRRARAEVPIAIASGALGAEIRRVLERESLIDCFAAIVSADDTAASKPDPDPYLRALAQLEAAAGTPFPARDCVAIEDSRWGLQSARAAGLRTLAVAHTYNKSALIEADLAIDAIADLDLRVLARLCSV